jgi:DNA polymerase-3 subunit epsilon
VYIAMTRGQDSLAIELEPARAASEAWVAQGERPALIVVPASEQELAEHDRLLAAIEAENKAPSVWRRFEAAVEVH